MRYVKCVYNEVYFKGDWGGTYEPDLIVGKVYPVAPPLPNDDPFMLRVYDGSYGQAGSEIGYLYPRDYFEPVYPNGQQATESITVHLDEYTKGVLHAQAILAQKSVSALVRQWIEERLNEPERVLE